MSTAGRKIYHITHVSNLAQMVDGLLWSDAERIRQGLNCHVVGMSEIKRRRLEELEVACHPGTKVGDYVPFYYCPRSVMLYLLHKGNHVDLSYRGGQGPIVHLEADLTSTIRWAESNGQRWALSKGNAGAGYAQFFAEVKDFAKLNWSAIAATDWQETFIREGKQAEFLLHTFFPWTLVERIGVIDQRRATEVSQLLAGANHKPVVAVERNWYY